MILNYLLFCFAATTINARIPDWLITDVKTPTTVTKTENGNLLLTNGLIRREFSIHPDFTTVDYYSIEKQASLLRAISPEATISLDGIIYKIGFVKTDIPRAYLNRSALKEDFQYVEGGYHFDGYTTEEPTAPYNYKPMRGAPKDIDWPPKGLRLNVCFKLKYTAHVYHYFVRPCIHYEMYDGIPAMSKWVTVTSDKMAYGKVKVSILSVEELAVNQQFTHQSHWDGPYNTYDWFFVGTNQAHGAVVQWKQDPSASLMPGSFEELINATYAPPTGESIPSLTLGAAGFESFRVHELLHCGDTELRRALSRHRLFRLLAPQTQENPIFFHMTQSNNESVHAVIDQMAEVGFEMMIYSFGSGFNIENYDEKYLLEIKAIVDYAKSKGIEVGGYDLIVLDRTVDYKYMAIDKNNKTLYATCMASAWYDYLLGKFTTFIDKTGIMMVETDGPYGGGACASTEHPHHENNEDSIYQQTLYQGEFFKELRKRNMFINQPDNFFYQGGSKTGLGYNENQYSLPRWQDISVSRQSLFDRIYNFIPTAGWMFLPLTVYHGGGAAAQFEPLQEHLDSYKFGLAQYLGAGVSACYRGYRLYDTEETKNLVKKWVDFYKQYRDILTSDIVRVRRPDMQSIDSYMHVNYKLENKGLAMVFNPTLERKVMNLTLPLYYTGISDIAVVSEQGRDATPYTLNKGWEIDIHVDMEPLAITWYNIQDGGE